MNRFGNRKAALEFWKRGMAQEVNDWHSVTGTLDQLEGLPAGLSSADAGDTLSVLAGHDGYCRLTVERNWSDQQHRSWTFRPGNCSRTDTDGLGTAPTHDLSVVLPTV